MPTTNSTSTSSASQAAKTAKAQPNGEQVPTPSAAAAAADAAAAGWVVGGPRWGEKGGEGRGKREEKGNWKARKPENGRCGEPRQGKGQVASSCAVRKEGRAQHVGDSRNVGDRRGQAAFDTFVVRTARRDRRDGPDGTRRGAARPRTCRTKGSETTLHELYCNELLHPTHAAFYQ